MAMKRKQNPQKPPNGREWRSLIWFFLIGIVFVAILTTYMNPQTQNQIEFSDFLNELEQGNVVNVTVKTTDRMIVGTTKGDTEFQTYYVDYPNFINELREKNVNIKVNPSDSGLFWSVLVQAFIPFILILLLYFFIFRPAQGASNQALSFGKSRATPWKKGEKDGEKAITFKDVAGADEAIEELKEIVDFLKSPKKYNDIGAKIPKGALLMGPPGTGKTLLAKAVAGEAGVPFFSLSGSDFVEMFVGVGASRVRDLFTQAKKNQPCIIFVDEIDAVGRHRGAGLGGGHDEREQTLNQLLVEMDGFGSMHTVIVIAATNRPDILDPALLRPGRFDRQIVVDKPDIKGRLDILKIHAKERKLNSKIDLQVVARRTPGFTGADLANLLNESALLSARKGLKTISMTEVEESTDRVMAGPQRKSRIMTDHEKKVIAYHEVGHALVAHFCDHTDPVHKISILPRGMALGYTLQLPERDKYLVSKEEMEDTIKVFMGGRIAEDLTFNQITSGASNDIERATDMARNYVCIYGMSTLGTRKYGKSQEKVFLGRDYSDHSKDYSDATAREIDMEIKRLIEDCYNKATEILKTNETLLKELSEILLEREVLDASEFLDIVDKSQSGRGAAR